MDELNRLFLPLNTSWYNLFKSGKKKWEARGISGRFNERSVRIGRMVELRKGYAKEGAIWGVITDFLITDSIYNIPISIKEELFPISTDSELWDEMNIYNNKYDKFIIFKIDLI